MFTYHLPYSLIRPKVYYELENFYANHRRFVKSLSYYQLRGVSRTISEIEYCEPIQRLKDLDDLPDLALNLDSTYSEDDIANPCGLIARYKFNDTFTIMESSSRKIVKIDETDITSSVNKESKFIRSSTEPQWTNVEDGKLK